MAQKSQNRAIVVNQASNANYASAWIKVSPFDSYSFTVATSASGTQAGTVAIRASDFGWGSANPSEQNLAVRPTDVPTTAQGFVLTITGSTATISTASTAYQVTDTRTPIAYTWVRFEYTDTSSGANTGTFSVAMTTHSMTKDY